MFLNGHLHTGDDVQAIVEKMKTSRIWVLATSVYWWGPTAQMKAFIDRWYGVPRSVFKGKRVLLVTSSGGGESYSELLLRMLGEIIEYLDMEYRVLQAVNASTKTIARTDSSLMDVAHGVGLDAVKSLI